MRVYEELFIVKPDAPEEEVDGFIDQIKQVITSGKGTVDKVDNWGVRKLAYRLAKYNEGRYVLIVFSSTPELVHEVERSMRVADLVIKFITVRIDEKQKKIDKRKKARDKRAARRPAPQAARSRAADAGLIPAIAWRRAGAACLAGTCEARTGASPNRPSPNRPSPKPAKAERRTRRRSKSWRKPKAEDLSADRCGPRAATRPSRQEAIFPAQEGVPVLRRQDRRYQLQGRAAADVLHQRARQDHAAAHFGRVRAAPAAVGRSDQAGAEYRADAVFERQFKGSESWKSFSEKTSINWARAASW